MTTKVLDSFALLAFFQDEPGAQIVENFILDAQRGNINLAICVINLGEIWYSISRTFNADSAENYIRQIQSMPIEIVDVNWSLTKQAAKFKAIGNISYADCFVAALAKIRSGEVVTGNSEFQAIESEVPVVWLNDKLA